MGAAGRCQARSEAVTVPGHAALTCRNVTQQRLYRPVHSVRIEMLISLHDGATIQALASDLPQVCDAPDHYPGRPHLARPPAVVDGKSLGRAATAARRALADNPTRQIGPVPVALQDYRLTPGRRIVMGGGPVGLGRGGDLDRDSDQKAWQHLEQHIGWLWPHLSGIAITHRWGGPFSVTMDLTPALGYLGEDRTAVYGLGCIGHGAAMSYLNGEVLADLLTGDADGPAARQCPFVNRRVIS